MPLLNTADDARKLVSSAKFPPKGKRGFSPELAIGKFASRRTGDYLLQANDALVTIAQIETKEALDNVRVRLSIHPIPSDAFPGRRDRRSTRN